MFVFIYLNYFSPQIVGSTRTLIETQQMVVTYLLATDYRVVGLSNLSTIMSEVYPLIPSHTFLYSHTYLVIF